MKLIKFILKGILQLIVLLIFVQLTRAYLYVNNDLKLKPWHRADGIEDLNYEEYSDIESYLRDEKVFLEKKYQEVEVKNDGVYNRYIRDSRSSPLGYLETDVNASFEMIPEDIKGGVLMLHGLTDSPFTMRDLAKVFYDKGYYVLSIRYPYHGTYPGELIKLDWKDFSKTAKFGAKMVKKKLDEVNQIKGIGEREEKFYMVGYSTGATAALQYVTYDMREDVELPKPDGVFWLSPAMGVSAAAKYGFLDIITSKIPGFSKFAWLDIVPEYDMGKYNSFAKNPGIQVYNLIKEARGNLMNLSEEERSKLPPVYAYTSREDATVDATELADVLKEMGNKDGELIIFDANRRYTEFYKPNVREVDFKKSISDSGIISDVVILSNYEDVTKNKVSLMKYSDGKRVEEESEYNQEWSEYTFSLAHISLPISPENPIYGRGSVLGSLNIKGEKGIISVSPELLIRLRYNDFFDYVKGSVEEKIKREDDSEKELEEGLE